MAFIKKTIQERLEAIGKRAGVISPHLRKDDDSKNITLSDWNTLVADVAYTESDIGLLSNTTIELAEIADDINASLVRLDRDTSKELADMRLATDRIPRVVQGTGASPSQVMSQSATTIILDGLDERIDNLEQYLPGTDVNTDLTNRIADVEKAITDLESSKLNAVKGGPNNARLYAVSVTNEQTSIRYVSDFDTPATIVQRTTGGQIVAADPKRPEHAATKDYVDTIGESISTSAETRLDNLDKDLEDIETAVSSFRNTVSNLSSAIATLKDNSIAHEEAYVLLSSKVDILDKTITGGELDGVDTPGLAQHILGSVSTMIDSRIPNAVDQAFESKIVDDTGNDSDLVMSQSAVTTELTKLDDAMKDVNGTLTSVSNNLSKLENDLDSVTAALDTKMPTVSNEEGMSQVLIFDAYSDTPTLIPAQYSATDASQGFAAHSIVQRDDYGRLQATTPKEPYDVATKEYVDDSISVELSFIADRPGTYPRRVINQPWVTSAIEALNGVTFGDVSSSDDKGIGLINEKLDKNLTYHLDNLPVYLYARDVRRNADGSVTPHNAFLASVSSSPGQYTVIRCNSNARYSCLDPTSDYETANKRYVDNAIANVSGGSGTGGGIVDLSAIIVDGTGDNTDKVMSQKACSEIFLQKVTTQGERRVYSITADGTQTTLDVVQTTGYSPDKVMSQQATTEAISGLTNTVNGFADDISTLNTRASSLETEHNALDTRVTNLETGGGGSGGGGGGGISITDAKINADGELVFTFSDGDTINVGKVVGANGTNGTNGTNGVDGEDGLTPYIGTNGNWCIGTVDTGVKAAGKDGADGADGKTPTFKVEDGELKVSYDNGETWTSLGNIQGGSGSGGDYSALEERVEAIAAVVEDYNGKLNEGRLQFLWDAHMDFKDYIDEFVVDVIEDLNGRVAALEGGASSGGGSSGGGSTKLYRHECRLMCDGYDSEDSSYYLICYFSFVSSVPTSLGDGTSQPHVITVLNALAGTSVTSATINCRGTLNSDSANRISFNRTGMNGTITVTWGDTVYEDGEVTFEIDNGMIVDIVSQVG